MRRTVVLVVVIVVSAVAIGVSIFAAARTPAPVPDASRGASVAAAPVTPAKPRAGRVIAVETAFKELDLIRPSRQKLAEDFTLATPKGQKVKLSDQRGKLVFINFWATWCPPCREEMPAMQRLWERQKDNGLVILAISLDSDPSVVPSFVKNHGFTFTVLVDPTMESANAYGVRALPASFIVDRQGVVTGLALGPRSWDNNAANSLFEGLGR